MLVSSLLLVGILLLGNTKLYQESAPALANSVASLQRSTLNATDAALQHKGYYEKLDNPSRMSAQVWGIQALKPAHWIGLNETAAMRPRDDFMRGDLQPGANIVFMDRPLTVNRWGMRDREHTLEKPKGTYRIVLLGPSLVMGSGVADGETFADFLEEHLNRRADPARGVRYEVLNFGVAGFALTQQAAMLKERALMFQPDAVFITDARHADVAVTAHLLDVMSRRIEIPFPELEAIVRRIGIGALTDEGLPVPFDSARAVLERVGVKTRMPWREAERRLRLAADDLVRWSLEYTVKTIREHGAVPVYLAADNVSDPPKKEVRAVRHAQAAGFLLFNLFDLWQGRDQPALYAGGADFHPNAEGHRLIGERIYELMQQHRAELGLGTFDRKGRE
jgi:alginate O-acetyltransferase complex protein AlgI